MTTLPRDTLFRLLVAPILVLLLSATLTHGSDVSSWVVNKHQQFNQTNSGAPVFQTNQPQPYEFEAAANSSAMFVVTNLVVKLPNGSISNGVPYPTNDNYGFGYALNAYFATESALDTSYPTGKYVLTISTVNDGVKIVTNNLPTSVYPSTPRVSNYSAAQAINPAMDFVLTWDPFTNATATNFVQIQIIDASGTTKVFQSPFAGSPGALTAASNSVVIPQNTLLANHAYNANLAIYNLIGQDTNSYPGATGRIIFWKKTYFSLQTTNYNGIFPIATGFGVFGGSVATSGSNYLGTFSDGTNLFVQLLSSNGAILGPLTTIGTTIGGPFVAFGKTNYLVVWTDDYHSNTKFGQVISPGGTPVGNAISMGTAGNDPQALAFDGTNFLVVIRSDTNYYYGQLVASDGTLLGSRFLITGQQGNAQGAGAAFGKTNYLVVWPSKNGSPGNKTYGAFVSPSGTAGSPFQISQTLSLDQNPLAVAFDGTNFFVIWNLDTQLAPNGGPIWNLYGRLVSQDGTFPGNELVINTNQPLFPSLAFDGANYLLGWGYNLDTTNSNKNIFFQFFNRSPSPIGPVFSLFQAQGSNSPLFGTVLFDGNKFADFAVLGSLIVSTNGSIQGIANSTTFGAFIPRSTAPPSLAAVLPFASPHFQLHLTGTPGINYAIQAATNLLATNTVWASLGTNAATNSSFAFDFVDTNATNKNRSYRAVKQ